VSTDFLALTETTIDGEIAGSPLPVLIEFWAEWCQPSKVLGPIVLPDVGRPPS
jgi:thioredoxin-like negative regulator of GroEL